MSVVLTGRAPFRKVLGYEKMLDETGREMHSSWGNTIDAPDAFARMGADVMRWQFCAQPPDRNLLFGFGPAQRDQAAAADALELGALPRRLRPDRGLHARRGARSASAEPSSRSTAGSPRGRRSSSRRRPRRTRRYLTVDVIRAFDEFVDDVSNWYIRRSRRRFWDGDAAALQALWTALVPGLARDRAGDAVPRRAPLAEPRARRGRGAARVGLPRRLARGGGAGRRAARRGRARCAASSRSATRRARRRS